LTGRYNTSPGYSIGIQRASIQTVTAVGHKNQCFRRGRLKKFPLPQRNILLIVISGAAIAMSSCQSAAVSANASAPGIGLAQVPVVAPAGSVLRVRLKDALDTGRSRPGDRFQALLDSPVFGSGGGKGVQVLPKDTPVSGWMTVVHDRRSGHITVTLALDSFQLDGRTSPLSTDSITRTIGVPSGVRMIADSRLALPADSIIGFSLTHSLRRIPAED